jgi:hypothetical protein
MQEQYFAVSIIRYLLRWPDNYEGKMKIYLLPDRKYSKWPELNDKMPDSQL